MPQPVPRDREREIEGQAEREIKSRGKRSARAEAGFRNGRYIGKFWIGKLNTHLLAAVARLIRRRRARLSRKNPPR